MIARMLDDERYWNDNGFPPVAKLNSCEAPHQYMQFFRHEGEVSYQNELLR